MTRRLRAAFLAVLFAPLPAFAVTHASTPRLAPTAVSPLPSYVRRVEPAVVGLRVKARADAPSSQRLGARRAGSGVIFDTRGYAVTVSYLVVDAQRIEAQLRDGRTVPAQLVGVDLETGLASCGWWGRGRGRRRSSATRATSSPGRARAQSGWTRTTTSCTRPARSRGCAASRPRGSTCWTARSS